MIVEVTKQDIDMANRMRANGNYWPSNGYCPIAQALKRKFSISYAWVTLDFFTCNGSKYWVPAEAANFIDTWDDYCEVQPITFEAKEVEF